MATFRDKLLPALDKIRGINGILGQRPFTVSVVLRTWTGTRVGLGASTDASSYVKVDLGKFNCKVKQVSEKDAIASGGLYSNQDLEIGPITPAFSGSAADGNAITTFDPLPGASPGEVFFNVQGPGHPAGGSWYKKVSQDVTKNYHYTFVVQRTAEIP